MLSGHSSRPDKLLVLSVLLLFAIFGAESYLGHWFLLRGRNWLAYLPVLVGGAGFLASFAYLVCPSPGTRILLRRLSVGSFLIGLMGLYFHVRSIAQSLATTLEVVTLSIPTAAAPLGLLLPSVLSLVVTGDGHSRDVWDCFDRNPNRDPRTLSLGRFNPDRTS